MWNQAGLNRFFWAIRAWYLLPKQARIKLDQNSTHLVSKLFFCDSRDLILAWYDIQSTLIYITTRIKDELFIYHDKSVNEPRLKKY